MKRCASRLLIPAKEFHRTSTSSSSLAPPRRKVQDSASSSSGKSLWPTMALSNTQANPVRRPLFALPCRRKTVRQDNSSEALSAKPLRQVLSDFWDSGFVRGHFLTLISTFERKGPLARRLHYNFYIERFIERFAVVSA